MTMILRDILSEYYPALLSGLWVTIKLCLRSWSVGLVCGTIIALWSYSSKRVKKIQSLTGLVVGSIPVLVLLFWMYFPLQTILDTNIDSFWLSVICFSCINMMMVAGIISDALSHFPHRYETSIATLGLTSRQARRNIKIPLITGHCLGPLLLAQITILHVSIFASLINVDEIFRQIQRINALVYRPIELYTLLGVFFLLITVPLHMMAKYRKKKAKHLYTYKA